MEDEEINIDDFIENIDIEKIEPIYNFVYTVYEEGQYRIKIID